MKFTLAFASLGLVTLLTACGSSSTVSSSQAISSGPSSASSQMATPSPSIQTTFASASQTASASRTTHASPTASASVSKSVSSSSNESAASSSVTSVAVSSQVAASNKSSVSAQPSVVPSQRVPVVTEASVAAAPTRSSQVVAPIATAPPETAGGNPAGIPAGAKLVTTVTGGQKGSPRVATILTPSGNIGCDIIEGQGVGCGVISLSEQAPHAPGSTKMPGWFYFTPAQGATYDTGRTDAPHFKLVDSETVAYGQLVYFDIYVCNSQSDGLTCANTQTGHGMYLNREGVKTF